MGLGKSGLNGEVTVLQGAKLHLEYTLGLIEGDLTSEVTVRRGSTVIEFHLIMHACFVTHDL